MQKKYNSNFSHLKALENSLPSVVFSDKVREAKPSPLGKVASEASRMRFHCMTLYLSEMR
jgi:hypothetical protein